MDVHGGRGSTCLEVLIAQTEHAAERGLQDFRCPTVRNGMVFPTPSGRPGQIAMWMGDSPGVKCPLAIIWVGVDSRVVAIKSPVMPTNRSTYTYRAAFVLETSPALVEQIDLRVGDLVYVVD